MPGSECLHKERERGEREAELYQRCDIFQEDSRQSLCHADQNWEINKSLFSIKD